MRNDIFDPQTGLPSDKSYLECGLPDFLEESIDKMVCAWSKLDSNKPYTLWDCDFCNLQADINYCEVEELISSEQAWYLREKYLRQKREVIM